MDNIKITDEWLYERNAPDGIKKWLKQYFPNGGNPLVVLDELAGPEIPEHWWPDWLWWEIRAIAIIAGNKINKHKVLTIDGDYRMEGSLFFCGDIKIRGNLTVGGNIYAHGIEAATIKANRVYIWRAEADYIDCTIIYGGGTIRAASIKAWKISGDIEADFVHANIIHAGTIHANHIKTNKLNCEHVDCKSVCLKGAVVDDLSYWTQKIVNFFKKE